MALLLRRSSPSAAKARTARWAWWDGERRGLEGEHEGAGRGRSPIVLPHGAAATLPGHLLTATFLCAEGALGGFASERSHISGEVTVGAHCPPGARCHAACRAGLGTGTAEGGSRAACTLLPAQPRPPRPRPAPGPAPRPALSRLRPRVWPPRAQCCGRFQRPLAA